MHISSEDSLLQDMMLLDSSPVNGDRALIPQARSHWSSAGRRGLNFSQVTSNLNSDTKIDIS